MISSFSTARFSRPALSGRRVARASARARSLFDSRSIQPTNLNDIADQKLGKGNRM